MRSASPSAGSRLSCITFSRFVLRLLRADRRNLSLVQSTSAVLSASRKRLDCPQTHRDRGRPFSPSTYRPIMNYYALRRQALLRNLKKDNQGPDAALITCPVNVTYLTGFTGDSSTVFVSPKASILVSDQRFEVQIREECPEVGKGGELELHIRPHNKTTTDATGEVL